MSSDDKAAIGLREVVESALSQARKRADGAFDGLKGSMDKNTAGVILQILARVREELLDEHGDEKAVLALLAESQEPPVGFRGVTITSQRTKFALGILGDIVAAEFSAGDEASGLDRAALLFGRAGKKSIARLKKAGDKSGRSRSEAAAIRHAGWRTDAERLLGQGVSARVVVDRIRRKSKLKSPKQPQKVLQDAGLIPKRAPKIKQK